MALKDTCKFGAFYDGGTFSGSTAALQRVQSWEQRYGIRMDIINNFRKAAYYNTPGGSGHITTAMNSMKSTGIQGRLHCMTWEWCGSNLKVTEPYRPIDINTGMWDSYITDFAIAYAQWGMTSYIRLFHEMNSNWYGWAGDPCCYKDAWQRIVDLFRQNGAGNVKWSWCSNGGDVPTWNKMDSYYPGSNYVDVIGFDQYNAYTGWRTFTDLCDGPYARVKAIDSSKPIWISETGTPEGSASISGWTAAGSPSKTDWYTEMFNATGFDDIEYILMFDSVGGFNWKIDSTTASTNGFKNLLATCPNVSPPPAPLGSAGMTTAQTGAQS